MIIIKITGGLGNQLFQYAIGRALSLKNNQELKLDISNCKMGGDNSSRFYCLNNFNINASVATKEDLNKTIGKSILYLKIIRFLDRKLKINLSSCIYIEKKSTDIIFDNEISKLKIKKNIYIQGRWMSEKYFNDYRDILLKEFNIKNKIDDKNNEILNKIYKTNSVSIHIRRGDYIYNKAVNSKYFNCSIDYYKSAIELISEKIDNPTYFIFSDDIEWAKENINFINDVIFVENTDDSNHVDLILMSKCKNNIICNSTFSWWGAWLNDNGRKVVISPVKWFNNVNISTADLIPNSWIKI